MSIFDKLKLFKNKMLDTLFPDGIKCIFCGDELNGKNINETCKECFATLPFITRACTRCGGSLPKGIIGVCNNCKTNNFHFENARSVMDYVEPISQIIHKIKFGGKPYPIKAMAKYMSEVYATSNWQVDYVTYVPVHDERKRERGYDQAELLAKEFSRLTKLPLLRLVDKVINNPPQATLSFAERKKNVFKAYRFDNKQSTKIKNKKVLIIDDIYTTGATTDEVASVIMNKKAKCCYVLTFAHSVLEENFNE